MESTGITIERVHFVFGNVAKLLPTTLERVVKFCDNYHMDSDPNYLIADICADCWNQSPSFLVLVAIKDSRVIAHLLASLDMHYGNRIAVIQQLEVDKGCGITKEIFDYGMKIVNDWAKEAKCKTFRIFTRNRALVRIFNRYGFNDTGRVLMTREVDGGENGR